MTPFVLTPSGGCRAIAQPSEPELESAQGARSKRWCLLLYYRAMFTDLFSSLAQGSGGSHEAPDRGGPGGAMAYSRDARFPSKDMLLRSRMLRLLHCLALHYTLA